MPRSLHFEVHHVLRLPQNFTSRSTKCCDCHELYTLRFKIVPATKCTVFSCSFPFEHPLEHPWNIYFDVDPSIFSTFGSLTSGWSQDGLELLITELARIPEALAPKGTQILVPERLRVGVFRRGRVGRTSAPHGPWLKSTLYSGLQTDRNGFQYLLNGFYFSIYLGVSLSLSFSERTFLGCSTWLRFLVAFVPAHQPLRFMRDG